MRVPVGEETINLAERYSTSAQPRNWLLIYRKKEAKTLFSTPRTKKATFLRRLEKAKLRCQVLVSFYRGAIESILSGNQHGSCLAPDRKALQPVIKKKSPAPIDRESSGEATCQQQPSQPQSGQPAATWQKIQKYLLLNHQTTEQRRSSGCPAEQKHIKTWLQYVWQSSIHFILAVRVSKLASGWMFLLVKGLQLTLCCTTSKSTLDMQMGDVYDAMCIYFSYFLLC